MPRLCIQEESEDTGENGGDHEKKKSDDNCYDGGDGNRMVEVPKEICKSYEKEY